MGDPIRGKDGGIMVDGSAMTFMDNFTLDATINTSEVTQYGEDTKVNFQTLKEWSASCSGTLDTSDAQQAALLDQFEDGTLGAKVFQFKTGASTYWEGSGVVTSASVGSAVADKVTVSFSVACAGDLART